MLCPELEELENIAGVFCDEYCRFLQEGPFYVCEATGELEPVQCDNCNMLKLFNLFEKMNRGKVAE